MTTSTVEVIASYLITPVKQSSGRQMSITASGTILWSQLSVNDRDCARKLANETIMSENGAQKIVLALHRCDLFSVVFSDCTDFSALFYALRAEKETPKAFESRFGAILSRFMAHSSDISLPEPLLAHILLSGARVADNQRANVLAASITTLTE